MECIGFEPTIVTFKEQTVPTNYDFSRNALCFTLQVPVEEGWTIHLENPLLAKDDWRSRSYRRLHKMQSDNQEKENAWQLIKQLGQNVSTISSLRAMCHSPDLADCLEEIIFAFDGYRWN